MAEAGRHGAAAFRRHLAVAGEYVVIDGRTVRAVVGQAEALPEVGPDGEIEPGRSISLTLPALAFAEAPVVHGTPARVRGRSYRMTSSRRTDSYLELTFAD